MTLDVRISDDTTFLEKMVYEIYSPFYNVVTWIIHGIQDSFDNYVFLINLRKENKELKYQIFKIEKELTLFEKSEKDNYKLKSMLNFSFSYPQSMIPAEVICWDATYHFNSIFINQGEESGIKYNMPVITDYGVVGKVISVSSHVAQVQLLIDKMSRISAIIKRTGEEGIVKGTGGDYLEMNYIPGESMVTIGDLLITSGYSTIYPKDLEIGKVIDIGYDSPSMTKVLSIEPSANFKKLTYVFIIVDENLSEVGNILEAEETEK
jgi:rod shape-determining protein MreC